VRGLFDAGAVAVTVHGRFLHQKGAKRGDCDWAAIDAIKAAFPDRVIIGNGDVRTHAQLQHRLATSAADAVMVGYGALRDPTLFGAERFELQQVVQEYIDLARRHPNKLIDVKRHSAGSPSTCARPSSSAFTCSTPPRSTKWSLCWAVGARRRMVLPPAERARARHHCRGSRPMDVPADGREGKPRVRKRVLKSIRKAVNKRARALEQAARDEPPPPRRRRHRRRRRGALRRRPRMTERLNT
jgi:hypothetical protein